MYFLNFKIVQSEHPITIQSNSIAFRLFSAEFRSVTLPAYTFFSTAPQTVEDVTPFSSRLDYRIPFLGCPLNGFSDNIFGQHEPYM